MGLQASASDRLESTSQAERGGVTGAVTVWGLQGQLSTEQGINVVLRIDYVMGCKAEFKVQGSSITI